MKLPKGAVKSSFPKPAGPLNFDTVVNHQQQYADGNTHRTVKVSGRQRTHVMNAEPAAMAGISQPE